MRSNQLSYLAIVFLIDGAKVWILFESDKRFANLLLKKTKKQGIGKRLFLVSYSE